MKKQYKVPNHKKTEHIYTVVEDVGEYLDVLAVHGDRVMFAWKHDDIPSEMKYSEFHDLTVSFALGLKEKLTENGQKVAIIGETSPFWVAAYLAVIASGNVAVPMDKELDPEEMAKFFAAADVCTVVYSNTFAKIIPEITSGSEKVKLLIPMHGSGYEAD